MELETLEEIENVLEDLLPYGLQLKLLTPSGYLDCSFDTQDLCKAIYENRKSFPQLFLTSKLKGGLLPSEYFIFLQPAQLNPLIRSEALLP
jgi:hypothetical protein